MMGEIHSAVVIGSGNVAESVAVAIAGCEALELRQVVARNAARAEAVAASFEFYLQDQYEVAKAPQIKTVGDYVIMIIFEEAEAMMKTVEETLAQ
jgi:shikimate 5-dehydrogenase